jgi:hypothetical protein
MIDLIKIPVKWKNSDEYQMLEIKIQFVWSVVLWSVVHGGTCGRV